MGSMNAITSVVPSVEYLLQYSPAAPEYLLGAFKLLLPNQLLLLLTDHMHRKH